MRAIRRGEKRTWLQLKMKYKNIVQTANRKKADARKTGGGRAPPLLTEAEALALSQNFGRPETEGIPGGSSSSEPTPQDTSAFITCNIPRPIYLFLSLFIQIFISLFHFFFFLPTYSDGAICLVEPPHATTDLVTDEECEETLSAAFTEGEPERPVEGMAGQQQEGPSTSTAPIDIKDIYKIFLLKKIEKTNKEMQFLDRQMRRADLEIELLEHKLEVGAWSQVNYVNYVNYRNIN
ncbi:uncharacterized protein LOC117816914 isoform X1 [Notolabrus celidotus]|uniref:uncharacterized protein LOC117816914 isoform X1 n=1 Tax=Notolabrus celidotus TaxID=1203425 RepID=UPI00148FA7AE|nr:uncharacterized protein LOC117816914 isoform X1 [Notolabrus celidotus]